MQWGAPQRLDAFAVLLVLSVLSEVGPRNKIAGTISLSVHSVVVLGAVAMVGPVGAAVVGGAAYLPRIGTLAHRAIVFNVGMSACCGVVAGIAYQLAHGADPATSFGAVALLVGVGVPLMVADVVHLLLNVSLVSGIQSVSRGVPFRAQLSMLLSSIGVSYVAYGVIALVLVILWLPAGVGPFSIVLVIAPLFAAQWGLGQYGAELTAHNRTLGALVAAVETKSPASTGQSALVAELSEWVAEELALATRDVEAARTAGMLHDVGLLAVPTPLLDPNRVLTREEERLVHDHLAEAAEMLRGISFLDRALVGIVHHGERVDGEGYPSRLTGEKIPPLARIVAVARAYAALVTPRSDRPALAPEDALAVLRDLAGTAYDPLVVAALGRAVVRHAEPIAVHAVKVARSGSAVALDDPPVRFRETPGRAAADRPVPDRPVPRAPGVDAAVTP